VNRTLALLAVLFVLPACNHKSPTEPVLRSFGTLSGVVTILPNVLPGDYSARKVQVYDAPHTNLLHNVDIDSQGTYLIELPPGDYVVDLKPNGADKSADVPAKVTIHTNVATRVDIRVQKG